METKGLEEFIKYLKNRTYDLSVRAQFQVRVTVYLSFDGKRQVFMQNKGRKILGILPVQILELQPDIIDVELEFNGKVENHSYNLNYSGVNENNRDFPENNRDFPEKGRDFPETPEKSRDINGIIRENNETPEKYRVINENNRDFPEIIRGNPETPEIKGLGNASSKSIESIVNKRLDEERKERKLTELETIINENNETLSKNTKTIEGLESKLVSKNEEIENLQKTIATKQNFKYYAGITGDILQSFGIKKELVAKPLAGLLAGSEAQDDPKAIEENTSFDESGIVDDEQVQKQPQSVDEKRNEMIALIGEFLKGVDNQTLSNTFSIFSEIENDPNNSSLILEYLKNQY
jgi:hypothetical protein